MFIGVTPNLEADTSFRAGFGPPLFIDGQGFLVARRSRIAKLSDLAGKQVCLIAGTGFEEALRSAFASQHINCLPFPFQERGEMAVALAKGQCTAITGDIAYLANVRLSFEGKARDFTILTTVIARDPFVPAFS